MRLLRVERTVEAVVASDEGSQDEEGNDWKGL